MDLIEIRIEAMRLAIATRPPNGEALIALAKAIAAYLSGE